MSRRLFGPMGPGFPCATGCCPARNGSRGSHPEVFFYICQTGVGFGDQPGVPGYFLGAVALVKGPLAFFGPAHRDPLYAGGTGNAVERSSEIVIVVTYPSSPGAISFHR